VLVAIVIMVIPISLGMPPTCVFIPPSMMGVPATLPHFVEFTTSAFGLVAPVAMTLNGVVQTVVRPGNAALARVAISVQKRRSGKHQKACQCRCGECCFSEERIVQTMSHKILLDNPRPVSRRALDH
jgi:hypothetical protein